MSSTTTRPIAVRRARSQEHREALDRLFQRIAQLSTLPGVAQRILTIANSKHSSAADLEEVVQQDPALSLRILRTVNSSYYGLRRNVGDLRGAIGLLGFEHVRNLAMTVYVARLCDAEAQYKCYSAAGLWRHMTVTAAIARLVSKTCNRADPEEAYLAGLLHDVGILLISQSMQAPLRKIVDEVLLGADQIISEQAALTFDHADLGAYIAQECGLPETLCSAILFHHAPQLCLDRDRELLHTLVFADYFASRSGCPALGVARDVLPDPEVLRGLGLRKPQLESLQAEIRGTIAAAESLVGI